MSCSTTPTTQQLLSEAEKAYHNLLTGTAVVEVTDQNGERVRFASARRADLYQYIQQLRAMLSVAPTVSPINGPAGFIF